MCSSACFIASVGHLSGAPPNTYEATSAVLTRPAAALNCVVMCRPLHTRLALGLLAVAFSIAHPAVVCGLACLAAETPLHFASHGHHHPDGDAPCQGGTITVQHHVPAQALGPAVPAADVVLGIQLDYSRPMLPSTPSPLVTFAPEIEDPPPRA